MTEIMPEFDDIKKLWKQADEQISAHESLDADAVNRAIAKKSLGITSKMLKSIRSGIFSLSMTVLLFGYNVYGYAGNDLVVTLCISCLVLSCILLTFLIFQHKRFGRIDQAGLSLRDILMSKIEYFKRSLYLVHQAIAMAIVLLIFGLNLMADNDGGTYYVGNMWVYIGFNITAYVCMIIILRLSHSLYLKQYENALSDLEKTKLTEMNAEIRKHRWIRRILLIIALLVVATGLFVFYIKVSG
jgi:hypothetical protein